MRKLLKILGITVGFLIMIILIGVFTYKRNYYKERDKIKEELELLNGVTVVDIWGHKDLTLEEINALIKIEDHGQIIITNLNKNDYSYPEYVSIPYIDGFSFTTFECAGRLGIGSSINIGEKSVLGKKIGIKFNSHLDVINSFDTILSFVKSLPQYPDLGHYFDDKGNELFIMVQRDKEPNTQDPLFNLIGIDDYFKYAETLDWKNKDCIN